MTVRRPLTSVNVEEFSGGCNYSRDMTSLKDVESPNAMNMIFRNGTVRKRPGYLELTPNGAGSGVYGWSLFDIGVSGVGRKLVAHLGDRVYKVDNMDGILDSIRVGAPNVQSYNAEVNQYLIQTYRNYSTEYYWDGSAAVMVPLSGSAPGFKHVVEHQGYLLGGNISSAKLRIYYEDVNTMIGGTYADFFTLPGGRDDELTGWLVVNGRAYATTKSRIARISFVGGVTVFEDKEVVSQTGMVPRTGQVVITEQFGEVAIFLGYDLNLYLFDGSVVKNISGKFRFSNNDTEIALDRLDENYFENFNATYDSIAQVYRLTATRRGDSTNKFMLNIDVTELSYYPFNNMTFNSTAIAQDNIGRRYFLGADYNGNIHKLFIDTNTDNGVVIKEYFEGPPITKRLDVQKKTVSIGLLFMPVANYKLIYEDRTDFDKTWVERDRLDMYDSRDRFIGINAVLGNMVLGSDVELLYHQAGILNTNNMYRFRLHTGAVEGDVVQYRLGTVSGSGGGTSLAGAGTAWTSDMTAARGWKIHIKSGDHANEVYDFTYVSSNSATVGTMVAGDFAGAEYELYRTGYAGAKKGWELMQLDYNAQLLSVGKAEAQR